MLGIAGVASGEEIRKAYRTLVRAHHPDVNPDDSEAEERFKNIQQAYEILPDPEKRREHDRSNRLSSGGASGQTDPRATGEEPAGFSGDF